MFCTQCGTEIHGDARFCNNCGHMLSGSTKQPTVRSSPEQSDKLEEDLKEVTVSIEKVASGQKFVVYALRTYLISICLDVIFSDIIRIPGGKIILLIGIIVGIILSLVGVFRLCTGMGYSIGAKIGLVALMAVPLLNIIILVMLNSHAIKSLRASGLEVVLFNWGKKKI